MRYPLSRLHVSALALTLAACGSPATMVPDDGGTEPHDAGKDSGVPDAGPHDGGHGDAGPDDAGPDDAGPGDAGPSDAGPEDAGPEDAGPDDAGPDDAGDAGPVDASAPSCTDGVQNGTETGIDCGGSCPPCMSTTSAVPFTAGRSSLLGDPSVSGWEPVDLDGDGKLDVVAKLSSFATALGHGDGVFTATGAFVSGSGPLDISGHGDFDGDAKGDVVGCFGNNGVRVFRGSAASPSGILDETIAQFAFKPTAYLSSCAAADFNGDGKPDIAASTSSGTVEIGLNSGTGITKGAVYPGLGSVSRLVAFDVDGQMGADLLALSQSSPPTLTLLLANGDGTFTAQPAATLPAGVSDVIPFRETGTSVVLRAGGGALFVATLAADGTLGTPASLSAQNYVSVAAGDLDENGTMELVAARLKGGFVDVFERMGATWIIKQTLRPNWLPTQVKLVDWNGDGKLDLTTMNAGSPVTLDVLLNQGNGTFPSPPQTAVDAAPFSGGGIGDLNGDGRPDVLLPVDSIPNQSYLDVYLTQAAGGFVKAAHAVLPNRGESFLVGELSGDGKPDVIALDTFNKITLLTGDGNGNLTAGAGFYGPPDASNLALGDIAATGTPQLLVPAPGGIRAYDPMGSFFGGTAHVVTSSAWPGLRAVADVDGDGKQDLVVTGLFSGGFAWQPSLGNYTFAAPITLGGQINVRAVLPLKLGPLPRRWLVVTDDGLHDWTETSNSLMDTYVGGAPGNFILRGDWNHDGNDDLVVAGAVISLYTGDALGNYTFTGTTLLGGGLANAIGFFDATGDGREDLVVVNHYGGITVLAGTP